MKKSNTTEKLEGSAVSGDGSKKTDGRSGCGVVIKGVDRDKWITISTIALLVRKKTATAAEVVVVCVLMGNLGLGAKKDNQCEYH